MVTQQVEILISTGARFSPRSRRLDTPMLCKVHSEQEGRKGDGKKEVKIKVYI